MATKLEDKPTTLVMKFGGTSVGSVEAMERVLGILAEQRHNWTRLVVVISAMSGVTDLLLESALDAQIGRPETSHLAASELRKKHYAVADELLPDLARQDSSETRDRPPDFGFPKSLSSDHSIR